MCVGTGSHKENNRQAERGGRGEGRKEESVEAIKDGIQRKHSFPFSPLLPIALLPLTARVSSRDDVKQISNASV